MDSLKVSGNDFNLAHLVLIFAAAFPEQIKIKRTALSTLTVDGGVFITIVVYVTKTLLKEKL